MIQPNQPQHYACCTCNSTMILHHRTIQRLAGEHDIKLRTCTYCNAAVESQSRVPRYDNSNAKCEIYPF